MKHSDVNWAHFVNLGLKLVGKPYRLGAEVNLKETDFAKIKEIDCSELTELLYAQINLPIPDGSYNQAKFCHKVSTPLIGDMGFKWNPENLVIHHVGVHIGEGRVLEAKGLKWGVVITPITDYIGSSHFAFWGRHPKIVDA